MRWPGFRKVRGQVCKRINARLRELGVPDFEAYRSHLEVNNDEWAVLDSFCRIPISRFYRDRSLFQFLERDVLVKLSELTVSRGDNELRCWSIGCASGEEPYTLALLWIASLQATFPGMDIRITATDVDPTMIERAKAGCYSQGSLRELPRDWLAQAFIREGNRYCIRAGEREKTSFLVQDIRRAAPEGLFHLILCRNLVFTYFDEALQREMLARLRDKLYEGGALIIGIKESLPTGFAGFTAWPGSPGVYRKDGNCSVGRIEHKEFKEKT